MAGIFLPAEKLEARREAHTEYQENQDNFSSKVALRLPRRIAVF